MLRDLVFRVPSIGSKKGADQRFEKGSLGFRVFRL